MNCHVESDVSPTSFPTINSDRFLPVLPIRRSLPSSPIELKACATYESCIASCTGMSTPKHFFDVYCDEPRAPPSAPSY